ncbi:sporulation histidine kinase inhibitor Sda [Paenibacillus paeoniae]|uniref:Sporulation histidine kinase inhibitor Sda n=1 Tax=Paenibacillus paeoniae TaxID=2292705 RepID=A0A371PK98_9BACL|nr:sporulation histidine kinase inhibitor Sda [Paenibacillus paeoniae]REK76638.1 sporulation histidine kinase inhibitor Sda [Paenibacillus paeoniae]
MVMDSRYTIHQTKLPDDELIQCYCEAVRYGCDPYFIRILADSITDRGLAMPLEGECDHGGI